MFSYWLPVLFAFCLGLTAVCLLEAVWRQRSGEKRPYPFLLLAGLCLFLAGLLWAHGRTPPVGNYELGIMNYEAEVYASNPTVSQIPTTLPPPLVTNYELGIRNDEGEGITSHASRSTNSHSPITDDQLPVTVPPTRLRIPALKINRPIVPVPVQAGAWDVAALGADVGLLATTGQHTDDDLAMVFAGHMTFADGRLLAQGAFADLQYATYGTEIMVDTGTETAVYQVSEISRIAPDDVNALYLADGNSILLLTCTDWNDRSRLYANRLLIRATRIKLQ